MDSLIDPDARLRDTAGVSRVQQPCEPTDGIAIVCPLTLVVGGRFVMRLFLYLLTVMVIVASVAIMVLENVFVGILVAALYGVAVCAIALVCQNADKEDEWEW